jgi:succinate dehydrogenase / fumarate reductase cytochrome b subunit
MIAFVFIVWHVFHMHGWIHAKWWTEGVATPLYGGIFRPYNAASTAAEAMRISGIVPVLYAIGVLSCVFHLANGIWTFGITWGLWVTPASQRWANVVCLVFGLALGVVSLGALGGFAAVVDVKQAREVEDAMYEHKVAAKEIEPDEHKRKHAEPAAPQQAAAPSPSPKP